jgi:hypothetical protein
MASLVVFGRAWNFSAMLLAGGAFAAAAAATIVVAAVELPL